jgi:hypothetical protein
MTPKERIHQLIDEMEVDEAEDVLRLLEDRRQAQKEIDRDERGSAFGKYAFVPTSSEDFMRRKHEETAREDARSERRTVRNGEFQARLRG